MPSAAAPLASTEVRQPLNYNYLHLFFILMVFNRKDSEKRRIIAIFAFNFVPLLSNYTLLSLTSPPSR